MMRLQRVRRETAVTDAIRKPLLRGERIPRTTPMAAREVIATEMINPGAKGSPTPPEFDHMSHVLAVYSLRLSPFDTVV